MSIVDRSVAGFDQRFCGRAGTSPYSQQLFLGNCGDTVYKLKRTEGEDCEGADGAGLGRRTRRRMDHRLAELYQATLEEPIPDDMLRLVEMIGTVDSRR